MSICIFFFYFAMSEFSTQINKKHFNFFCSMCIRESFLNKFGSRYMMNILVNWSTLEVHFPLAESGDKIKLNSFKIGSLIFQLVWCKTLQYFIIKCVEQNKIHWCSHFFPSLSSRPNIRPKKYCGCVNTPKKKIKALICFFIFSFFSASFDGNKKRHCI